MCVCVRARARDVEMFFFFLKIAFIFSDFCLCACNRGRHIAHKFESGWEVGVIKAFEEGPSRWEVQPEVQG